MLTLRVLSDLHLEFWKDPDLIWRELERQLSYFRDDPQPDEIMCLCGDIGHPLDDEGKVSDSYRQLLSMFVKRWPRTLLIAGNHEYYCCRQKQRELAVDALQVLCVETGAVFLNRAKLVLDGVTFLGCTLWSDITLRDYRALSDSLFAFNSHNDYLAAHIQDELWLQEALAALDGPTVVLTHHLCTAALIHPRFAACSNTGFATPLHALLERHADKIKLWFCGHSHESREVQGPGGMVLALSPLGYPGEEKDARLLDKSFTVVHF
jgi:hypothetical protein